MHLAAVVLAAAVSAHLAAPAAPGQMVIVGPGKVRLDPVKAGGGRPMPLVNADDEMASFVKRAQDRIAKKDYDVAIEILQALLNRRQQCFVPTGDGRRYVSLAAVASSVIGALPADGMALYRRMYDPEADELLRRARERMDETALRDVVRRYFHTSHGDDALNLLGTVLFDRGQFSQAARCWHDVLRAYKNTDLDRACLLVKVAVAHHFAGEDRRAAEAVKQLRARHGGARCRLGGQQTEAVAFAERMLAAAPPRFAAGPTVVAGWGSLAGHPSGVAVMTPCRPVLHPRWTQPRGRTLKKRTLKDLFGYAPWTRVLHRRVVGGRVVTTQAPGPELELHEGRVRVRYKVGNKVQRFDLPATIHPVVVGTTVIIRAPEAVVAYDLLTGEKVWDTFNDFPLYREEKATGTRRRIYSANVYAHAGAFEDEGRCTLTIGGGKVFAVGRFRPRAVVRYYSRTRQPVQEPDSSVLAAFSLSGEGKLVWRSNDRGRPEIMLGCKFLSAPTYVDGRLYVLAEYMETYYLFCLDADSGRGVWAKPAMVSQTPAQPTRRSVRYAMLSSDRGSPPAVADGRVYVCTNAGVVAAFEAETGRGLWAYQYDSDLNQPGRSARVVRRPGQVSGGHPPNPIIVTRGRVICLPADADELLALRADTGEPAWPRKTDRRDFRYLAAVDEQRVLLSGPGLRILAADSGRELWPGDRPGKNVRDAYGRPAVTRDAILTSGKGQVVIVHLDDLTVTYPPLVDSGAVLGNLVCVDGKLLAANAAGVSAYFTFEDAHRELTGRVSKASEDQLAQLLYQRGMNAFNAKRPEQALADLLKAQATAKDGGPTLPARIGQALYRVYVALGNKASGNAEMRRLFARAEKHAYSDRSRAEMLLRLAKYEARAGRYAEAARLAQELTVKHAETDMVDVEIGSAADPYVRDDADTPRSTGFELGQKVIGQLISAHGRQCYSAFDARARAALEAAVKADRPEAMIEVSRTYRHSTFAPMALLRAGESHYRRAVKASGPARREHLGRAGQVLSRVTREYPKSGLAASASLGLAMVYKQMNPRIVWLGLQALEGRPSSTSVAFADFRGSLGEALKRFDASVRRSRRRPEPLQVAIRPPMRKLYEVPGEGMVVRDEEGRPLRLDGRLFLLSGSRLSLLDPTAASYKAGRKWEAPLPLDTKRLYRYGFASWASSMIGALTRDGKVFAMGCRAGFFGLNAQTGKVIWRKGTGDNLVTRLNWMAAGDDRLVVLSSTGDVTAVDIRSGKNISLPAIGRNAIPWRAPPQLKGGLLLTVHGRTEWSATLFDLKARKTLGSIKLSQGRGQAFLTADGLVVACDGASVRLIEPVLGIKRNIWSVRLPSAMQPAIVGMTDTEVLVSPNYQSGLLELRGLADYGRIVRSFQTRATGGSTAVPVDAHIVGDRVYVLTSTTGSNRHTRYAGRMTYAQSPSLQAFDINTGKLLWTSNLTLPGATSRLYIMPLEICRGHIGLIVKQNYMKPANVMVLESRTGRLVQKVEIPGIQRVNAKNRLQYLRHFWLGGPTLAEGRMLVEHQKSIQVYGTPESGPKR